MHILYIPSAVQCVGYVRSPVCRKFYRTSSYTEQSVGWHEILNGVSLLLPCVGFERCVAVSGFREPRQLQNERNKGAGIYLDPDLKGKPMGKNISIRGALLYAAEGLVIIGVDRLRDHLDRARKLEINILAPCGSQRQLRHVLPVFARHTCVEFDGEQTGAEQKTCRDTSCCQS
jgi:hypothetical protein